MSLPSLLHSRVRELNDRSGLTKHKSLVRGIISSIEDRVLTRGDALPSVNVLMEEIGFARQTIVNAYAELKERGIIEARNRRGYYVASETTDQTTKVALLLYAFLPFQEIFYNTFRETLGETVQVDVYFHHNNVDVFQDLLQKISGQYGYYVIAPPEHPKVVRMLSILPQGRCLMVDRPSPGGDFPYVSQQFAEPSLRIYEQLAQRAKNYTEIVLFYRPDVDYPAGNHTSFLKMIARTGLNGRVLPQYAPGSLRREVLYITIGDSDLWPLLEDSVDRGWTPGREFGVVSHNDSRIKKIICGGITTITTDFAEMARRAAQFVLTRKEIKEYIPTVLVERASV